MSSDSGLPAELWSDIKQAAYDAKVRELTEATAPAPSSADGTSVMPPGVRLIGMLGDGRMWVSHNGGPSRCVTPEQLTQLGGSRTP